MPNVDEIPLKELRQWYAKAVESDSADLWDLIKDYSGPQPIRMAYKGAALALQSREVWNPLEKYSRLKHSMSLLTSAILSSPQNLEMRFLRFSIQHHIPGFVGLSEHLDEDKDVIMTWLPDAEKADFGRFWEIMIRFMLESSRCSKEETRALKTLL